MATPDIDFSFLQNLYGQDTLYVVPEEKLLARQPLPQTAALVEIQPAETNRPAPIVESQQVEETEEEPMLTTSSASDTAPVPTVPPALAPDIIWLGEALKGTYLLFEVPETEFQQLPQHPFLEKVLKAVGLGPLEVKFGNLSAAKSHNIKEIAHTVQARHILLFGDALPVENVLKLDPYRMYKLEETCFVRVDSVAALEQNNELKAKLWEVLKKIFLQ